MKTKSSPKLGNVVIVMPTGQSGTLINIDEEITVLLTNRDLWYGSMSEIRIAQKEELKACPLNIDRFAHRKSYNRNE